MQWSHQFFPLWSIHTDLGDVFVYCDTSQFYLEDNHVVLQAVESRDFKMSTKTLKKHASRIGIPSEIDVRAAQNALETSLSDLSEDARAELSGAKESDPHAEEEEVSDDDKSSVKDQQQDNDPADSGNLNLYVRALAEFVFRKESV